MGLSFFELLKDHHVDQIGYIYKDVEEQAKKMERVLGLPKFAIIPNAKSKVTYRGKQTEMEAKIGISRIMNTQIELIQWISGECYHKEYLEKYGEGFYHISVIVEDLNPYFELFKSLNIEVLQDRYIGVQHAVYFDTKEIFGIVIELQATEGRRKKV
ncbi:MAG: hypothetical protein EU542_02840 [Promethearchaeota archaeon]|nr:MAG: hypothetical protein EU542_02840 [Candidatus Lokiarchaeota archaeon]